MQFKILRVICKYKKIKHNYLVIFLKGLDMYQYTFADLISSFIFSISFNLEN